MRRVAFSHFNAFKISKSHEIELAFAFVYIVLYVMLPKEQTYFIVWCTFVNELLWDRFV